MAPETYYMAKASQNIFEELSSYIDSAWPQGTVSPTAAEGWIDSVDPASPVLQDFKTGPQSVSTWPGGKPTPQAAAPYAYDAQFLMWQGNDGKPYVNPFHPITVANEHFDDALGAGNNVFAIKPDGQVAFMCVPWAVEFEVTSPAPATWWYVQGVAKYTALGAGYVMVTPLVKGEIASEPASQVAGTPSWAGKCTLSTLYHVPPCTQPANLVPITSIN